MIRYRSSYSLPFFIAASCAMPAAYAASEAAAAEAKPTYTLSGHIDLVSTYPVRGLTTTYNNFLPSSGNRAGDAPESDKPALQWGVDYAHESGWYAGYFASQINYSYDRVGHTYDDPSISGGFQNNKSIENDLYAGYNGKLGNWGYVLGLTGYYYTNGRHSEALETKIGISYGPFALNTQTLLNDALAGNKGDTYVTLNYTDELPYKITFNASLGGFIYKREGKFYGTSNTIDGSSCPTGTAFIVSGCYAGSGPIQSGFRHLILGFTQPIASTPLVWGLQGVIGGDNRFGIHQKNKVVASISYIF
jgi:uncharacterized protein (TIGR02001 family)